MSSTVADESFFRAIVRDLDDALFVVDRRQRVIYFNPRAEEITGLRSSEVLGKSCLEAFRCPSCQPECGLFDRGELRDLEVELVARGGERVLVRKTAVLLHDEEGHVTGAIETFREVNRDEPVPARVTRTWASDDGHALRNIVGRSNAVHRVVDTIRRLKNSDVSVLITGESGTGKELVARALHDESRRSTKPFVAVNCAALPADLVESELFGHVRGAFTGAVRHRAGAVELAEGGTFFLDEIGDLAPSLQAKLLRLLQERSYQRVGESSWRTADIRVLAATHVDLDLAVEHGRFRADLYYRLRVVPLHLPALRERCEDIAPLASYLLSRRSTAAGRPPMRFSPDAMRILERHAWPGNVRELVNVVDYVVALAPDATVGSRELPDELRSAKPASAREVPRRRYAEAGDPGEAQRIRAALVANGYHRQRTANALGMDRVTLYRKMKEHGLGDLPRG